MSRKLTAKPALPKLAFLGLATAGALGLAAPAGAQLGPDAAACRAGASGQAVLVTVDGLRQRTGNIRVAIYGSDPRKFLARGQYVRRLDVPATRSGPMRICVSLPQAGRYAVAVRHDMNGNGRSDWSDGGGFSRNPRVSLTNLRPAYNNVAINVGRGVTPVGVVLNYRFGLAIRPVRG